MITQGYNKQDIVNLGSVVWPKIKDYVMSHSGNAAGIYHGDNMTDCVWVKSGQKASLFWISPCMIHGRADSFITKDGNIELTYHAVEKYYKRCIKHHSVSVFDAVDEKETNIAKHLAEFFINERVLGKVGHTRNRGDVIRTTNGVLFCSDRRKHDGIQLCNTFVHYNLLCDSQKEAVDFFDSGQKILSNDIYSSYWECHYNPKVRCNVCMKKNGNGTRRVKIKEKQLLKNMTKCFVTSI